MLRHFKARASRFRTEDAWGDGLVDRSITTLCYGADWQTVSDDELIFFFPALCRAEGLNDAADGAAARIEQKIIPTLQALSLRLQHDGSSRDFVSASNLLRQSGVARTILHRFDMAEFSGEAIQDQRGVSAVDAFCRVAMMDRMLYDALRAGDRHEPPLVTSVDLPNVLLSSIHTRVNGAVVYPSTQYAHELLSVGAWLGIVLTGRSALMPIHVAQTMVDYLTSLSPQQDRIQSRVRAILECYADLSGGRHRLLAIARKTLAHGPRVFRPADPGKGAQGIELHVWEPDLAEHVRAFFRNIDKQRPTPVAVP